MTSSAARIVALELDAFLQERSTKLPPSSPSSLSDSILSLKESHCEGGGGYRTQCGCPQPAVRLKSPSREELYRGED